MGQNSSTRSIIAAASVAPPMCTGPSASATCAGSRTSRAYGSTDSSVVETTIFGVDACRGKWLAVVLDDGRFADARLARDAASLAVAWPDAAAIGVDIPIGL